MMREKFDLQDDRITVAVATHYGHEIVAVDFLPLGYDPNTAVYKLTAADGASYFLKVRRGLPSPASLVVPRALLDHGIPNILAPLRTLTDSLWCALDAYTLILYPFIEGENAMTAGMSDQQWVEFGMTLRAIHTSGVAARFEGQVPRESFGMVASEPVKQLHTAIPTATFASPVACAFAAFWQENTRLIEHIVGRAEALGRRLRERAAEFEDVLCHADIHAANILIDRAGQILLVDWDGPLIAPMERDLLFVVGSTIARRVTAEDEARFFQGYGRVPVDMMLLAYYRYERVLEDLGIDGQRILLAPDLSEASREEAATLVRSWFEPGEIIALALEADRSNS
jgi:spectinomycin phosphotransferase